MRRQVVRWHHSSGQYLKSSARVCVPCLPAGHQAMLGEGLEGAEGEEEQEEEEEPNLHSAASDGEGCASSEHA